MRSQLPFNDGLRWNPNSTLGSQYDQAQEPYSPGRAGFTARGLDRGHRFAAHPYKRLNARKSRTKSVPTAEIFGHVVGHFRDDYPEKDDDDDEDDSCDRATSSRDEVPSPPKKQVRKVLRESSVVRRRLTTKPPNPKQKTSLPPKGTMQCLWGEDCTVTMAFDYAIDTIKGWKSHISSHLTKSNPRPTGDGGRGKMVRCDWDGCGAIVEKGYLFKHIVTHEMRFKLLCPHGCGVAIRDDNLERHLRSCATYEI